MTNTTKQQITESLEYKIANDPEIIELNEQITTLEQQSQDVDTIEKILFLKGLRASTIVQYTKINNYRKTII